MIRAIAPAFFQLAITLGVAAGSILLVLIPFALTQSDPSSIVATFLFTPFSSIRYMGNIAEAATPIALTGLAAAIIFRSGLFNLGMESSFFLGGLGATAAAVLLPTPAVLASSVAIVCGLLAGSFACTIPGWLRVRCGAPEMVTSLVLNYAMLFLGLFILNYFLRDPAAGALLSFRIPADARLERILPGTRLNTGSIIAVAACITGGIWIFYTRSGLRLRIVGASSSFSDHLGLAGNRVVLFAQFLGGSIAGMAGAIEVLGLYSRFSWTSLPGLGWTGIIVAILARDNPFLILAASLFFAWLQVGADILSRSHGIPTEISGLIAAGIMLVMTAKAIIEHPRLLAALRNLRSSGDLR